MSNNGPNQFTPNELEKFEEIYQAHLNRDVKKVKKLKGKLTPLEEDRYDLYLRAAEQETTNKPVLTQHNQARSKTNTERKDPEPDNTNDKKNRGGCSIS